MKKNISILMVIFLLTFSLIGCGEKRTPINSSFLQFMEQYEKDTEAKKKSYVGQYVEWEGTIKEVNEYKNDSEKDNRIVFIVGYIDGDKNQPIIVTATGKFDKSIIELKKETTVKVNGKFKDKTSNTQWELENSKVISPTSN